MSTERKHSEPLWWGLFGAGGVMAALFIPAHVFVFGVAMPLGIVDPPAHESMFDLVSHPITRVYLFVLVSLSLFHWAHRFRFTLYDGLQLKHLEALIVVFCYGSAIAGTAAAAYLLIRL